jgi:hypothetical protein
VRRGRPAWGCEWESHIGCRLLTPLSGLGHARSVPFPASTTTTRDHRESIRGVGRTVAPCRGPRWLSGHPSRHGTGNERVALRRRSASDTGRCSGVATYATEHDCGLNGMHSPRGGGTTRLRIRLYGESNLPPAVSITRLSIRATNPAASDSPGMAVHSA